MIYINLSRHTFLHYSNSSIFDHHADTLSDPKVLFYLKLLAVVAIAVFVLAIFPLFECNDEVLNYSKSLALLYHNKKK